MKQWGATAFLVLLFAFVIISALNENDEKEADSGLQEYSDRDQEGAGMTAPNAPDGLEEGEQAPDFTLQTLEGETVKLSDFKGKKVFLNYWATWCPPCREEMPEMQRFHEEFGDEVVILAVNGTGSEKSVKQVKEYVQEGEYTFPILLDKDLAINQTYEIISIPTTYFIGTDGVIQQPRIVGPMTYEYMKEMKNALN
ncbi:peroxiredoxin family protein [Halobacillus litoralis]|uniref:Cytochrome C biogenesis protein n=1 Tax=Halobacillus litoralis TaxID=45668 RepID=A0A410M7L8_9BACI|nr:TlpA disulfide reductase family protein [Halobacillus litoralis]QAS50900.1 cytochrome C biogenesis protein [Halobacillus litoralis]